MFSGLDNSGKSTCIKKTAATLSILNSNLEVIWLRGGYTRIFSFFKKKLHLTGKGERLDTLILDKRRLRSKILQRIWLLIAILDLILEMVVIRIKKRSGKTIVLDRYIIDTIIDFKVKFPYVYRPNGIMTRLLFKVMPKPDVHFLCVVSPETSARRSLLKKEPFPMNSTILAIKYAEYNKALLENNNCDMVVLDSEKLSLEEMASNVLDYLRTELE
ncbi:hypothetical protein [Mesotoga sp. B105.6.4]|uniref:hypothetical protein n=1 Tax=Mesotoga sp. B105.6.4 TaxID=1582224 RepID=UPI000CCC4F7C|nr:hypothetical protein [Mesotoga sp. B105.6.4]PNS34600.1 hypothetical protein RJ60_14690 [Mesotoga sp. B105.6.4]